MNILKKFFGHSKTKPLGKTLKEIIADNEVESAHKALCGKRCAGGVK